MRGVMPGLPRQCRRIRRLVRVPGDGRQMMRGVPGQPSRMPGNQKRLCPLVCLITGRIGKDLAWTADDADGAGLGVGI
jgi:hypothetical protein